MLSFRAPAQDEDIKGEIIMNARSSRREVIKSASAGLATVLMPGRIAFGQATQPIPTAEAEAEAKRLLNSSQIIFDYAKQVHELDKQLRLSAADAKRLDQIAGRLKTAVPTLKRDLQSVVQKTKASGTWDRLDAILEERLAGSNPSEGRQFLNLVKEEGGARSLIERALAELERLPEQINQEVSALKRKRAELLPFDLTTAAHAKFNIKCGIGGAAIIGAAVLCGFCAVGAFIGVNMACN